MNEEDKTPKVIDATHESNEAARKAAMEKMQQAIKEQKKADAAGTSTSPKKLKKPDVQTSEKKDVGAPKTKSTVLKNVKIYSPFNVYYNNSAVSVSAENLTGPFDVLAGHKNFMSLLVPCEVVVRTGAREERIKIDRGVMHVRDNKVTIFLDV